LELKMVVWNIALTIGLFAVGVLAWRARDLGMIAEYAARRAEGQLMKRRSDPVDMAADELVATQAGLDLANRNWRKRAR
jgi:hypothetical protein